VIFKGTFIENIIIESLDSNNLEDKGTEDLSLLYQSREMFRMSQGTVRLCEK
jgi:hypothetical protein